MHRADRAGRRKAGESNEFNLGSVAMNATLRLPRWFGVGATLRPGFESTVPRRGHILRFLPVLMLGWMALAAHAQYQFRTEVNPDGTLTVYKTLKEWGAGCPTGALTIPDTLDGRSVTSIGDAAFSGCTGLTSITIPDGVTSIGDWAFIGCISLTTATIGIGVTRIGFGAFEMCTGLPGITIPNSVTSIGNMAFQDCSGLIAATIGNGVTNLGNMAFYGCTGLTNVTIPDGVTSIGDAAFSHCTSLSTATIGNSVTSIGSEAFQTCAGLTSVTIPNSVTRIGDQAFSTCGRLNTATIGSGVTSIGEAAFSDCTRLTSVTIPTSVTSIGRWAFGACVSLQKVYFAGDSPPAADVFGIWYGTSLSPTTAYYLPGTKGWTSTFSGRPTAPWVRPQPTILDLGDRFGPTTNGFGFVISWATNVPVVVEASADIGSAGWTLISTNTLTEGWVQFMDPDWKSQPARFYRVRGQ